jgi:hypothetical protein
MEDSKWPVPGVLSGGVRASLIGKFYAAGISVPPYHAAMLCRFEAIQRQVKFQAGSVMRG